MADCDFFSKNPDSCQGLGYRLKNFTVTGNISGELPNNCVNFDIGDWRLEDKYYFVDVVPAQHEKGTKPIVSLQERVSSDCYEEVYADRLFFKEDGTIKVRVLCLPDCRFEGRLIIDG